MGELGAVGVATVFAHRAGGSRRTARHIRQSDPNFCKIDILASGRGVIAQVARRGCGVVAPETRQHVPILRIEAFVEERLGDPELSPGAIAARWGISSATHFNRAFRAAGVIPRCVIMVIRSK